MSALHTMKLLEERHKHSIKVVDEHKQQNKEQELHRSSISTNRSCSSRETSSGSVGGENKNHPIILRTKPCSSVLGIVEKLCVATRMSVIGEHNGWFQFGDTNGKNDSICSAVEVNVTFIYMLLQVWDFEVPTSRNR